MLAYCTKVAVVLLRTVMDIGIWKVMCLIMCSVILEVGYRGRYLSLLVYCVQVLT
jgi:hypothetical protein